jgi:hypothetical protein
MRSLTVQAQAGHHPERQASPYRRATRASVAAARSPAPFSFARSDRVRLRSARAASGRRRFQGAVAARGAAVPDMQRMPHAHRRLAMQAQQRA